MSSRSDWDGDLYHPNTTAPLTAEEYLQLATDIAEQQRVLDEERAALMARMQIGADSTVTGNQPLPPWGQPFADIFKKSDAYFGTTVVQFARNGMTSTIEQSYQVNGADIVYEGVHCLPTYVRPDGRPGYGPSATQPMLACMDSGNYYTLEEHLAGRTPLYRQIDNNGILPTWRAELPPSPTTF